MTEDGIVGWYHQFKGHEFEQTPGDSEGQGSLVCCRPRGHRVRHNWEAKQVGLPEKSVWVPVSGPPRGWEVSSVQPRVALPARGLGPSGLALTVVNAKSTGRVGSLAAFFFS